MTAADRYQLLPALADDAYRSLKADIAAHGVRVPVVIDAKSGAVLDGHHRIRAWEELRAEGVKVPDYPRQVIRFASDDERVEFVVAANLFRRHLTRRQRAELVAGLRDKGWSLRRIGDALGTSKSTVAADLTGVQNRTPGKARRPSTVVGKDAKSYPAQRPPSLFVTGRRDAERARSALAALPKDVRPTSLLRAEERAREARYAAKQKRAAGLAPRVGGAGFELRVGHVREVWDDIADGSIDAIVTDPPYNEEGIPLYGDLARLAARVLKAGRLAAVYCGHLHLDEELRLLEEGGLSYVWHGVNVLPGRHTKVRVRMVNGRHRSVMLFSAGPYQPRKWLHDTFFATGRGGPDTRPLHPWQQAVEPLVHWVQMVSEPGELVLDPFCGSGTTGVAALRTGRRFLGGDLEPAHVATTQERMESIDVPSQSDRLHGDT
ncbi:MAG: DNA methyltransferase [Acidimicrobiales bacterium]